MLANARVVALLLALSVAVITTSFLTLVEGISLITLILCFVLSFSSSYILSFITLEFFIFGEINKIYDRLNALKSENLSRIQFQQRKRGGSNPIYKINDEIFTYAEVKQREIEELKRSEEFRRQFIAVQKKKEETKKRS
jgi:two-component system phosphate regulon sensor histidine kinase PhoR